MLELDCLDLTYRVIMTTVRNVNRCLVLSLRGNTSTETLLIGLRNGGTTVHWIFCERLRDIGNTGLDVLSRKSCFDFRECLLSLTAS